MRAPTEKQYRYMLPLAGGGAGLSRTKRETEPLLRHGWVTADWRPPYYQFVRITPAGFRAIARAVERYGLPELGPKLETSVRVCAECGSERYRIETKEVAA